VGPWRNCEDALFAEVRAELFGAVVPGQSDFVRVGGLVRLTDAAYRGHRLGAIGSKAVAGVLKVAKALGPEVIEIVFPELVAATTTVNRLRVSPIREGFAFFDRIVVDEAQGLTRPLRWRRGGVAPVDGIPRACRRRSSPTARPRGRGVD